MPSARGSTESWTLRLYDSVLGYLFIDLLIVLYSGVINISYHLSFNRKSGLTVDMKRLTSRIGDKT
jgi:hypothetical protein